MSSKMLEREKQMQFEKAQAEGRDPEWRDHEEATEHASMLDSDFREQILRNKAKSDEHMASFLGSSTGTRISEPRVSSSATGEDHRVSGTRISEPRVSSSSTGEDHRVSGTRISEPRVSSSTGEDRVSATSRRSNGSRASAILVEDGRFGPSGSRPSGSRLFGSRASGSRPSGSRPSASNRNSEAGR